MSVELNPPELGFKRTSQCLRVCLRECQHTDSSHLGPFTHEVSQTLRLHNPNSDPIAFKVKTTAPKQYVGRQLISRSANEMEDEVFGG